ncbi:hypothetical protein [Nocardioides abyssi]|uniref:Uncharacterized protein n=1 Tax=Nocardioides abyssi TaxID=3058370 RepID=A0ABT8EVH2_9ACTN|nr:hypothetical protein [Nocardioides abyssi]MDN4162178.1 hypothetical protein [Nocardioides abyssi]
MTPTNHRRHDGHRPDYTTLPPEVTLEETVRSVDADPVPDPHAGRNVDQHAALQDD